MANVPFNFRFLCLTAALLLITFVLSTSIKISSYWAVRLVGPNYHPPSQHGSPVPVQSGLLSEDGDTMFAGNEARLIYELGKLRHPQAEEASKGGDWLESYQPGISSETYKKIANGG